MANERGSILAGIFLWIFFAFILIWFLGCLVFHIAASFSHVLIVVAIIALAIHFLKPRP